MVATVADPVASRMSTASSQASNSTEMLTRFGPSGEHRADSGVHQHLLESAAGRDDHDDARHRGSPDSTAAAISARSSRRRGPT